MESLETSLQRLISYLPLLPVIGFVFALSYEVSFFYQLDVSIGQVLGIADILESSAFLVLPAIPLLIFGFWLGVPEDRNEDSVYERTVGFGYKAAIFLAGLTCVFSACAFLFFGIVSSFGYTSFLLLTAFVILRITVFPVLSGLHGHKLVGGLFIVAALVFAGQGAHVAFELRQGNIEKFPLLVDGVDLLEDENLRVARVFSTGVLLVAKERDVFWFYSGDGILTEYHLESEPFEGLICFYFQYCETSRWAAMGT